MDKLILVAAIGIYAAGVVWPLWVELRNPAQQQSDDPASGR